MDVLVLNMGYQPIGIIDWQKAITLFFRNKVEIVTEYEDKFIRSTSVKFKMPAIIRLVGFMLPKKKIQIYKTLTKKNLYIRDMGMCQYCGCEVRLDEMTEDHIIPRSKGGKRIFDNLVVACSDCNEKKDNKTLEEAGMVLMRKPYRPLKLAIDKEYIVMSVSAGKLGHRSWIDYFNGKLWK